MAEASASAAASEDVIVQYIATRKDLKWPTGAIVGQACHASVAAIELNREDPETQAYLKDYQHMHKVVVGVESEAALKKLAEDLAAASIPHHLWMEEPEKIPTALATKPAFRSKLKPLFAAFKLLR